MPARLRILIGLLVLVTAMFSIEAWLLPGYRPRWEAVGIFNLFTAYLLALSVRPSPWLAFGSAAYLAGFSFSQLYLVLDHWGESLEPAGIAISDPFTRIMVMVPSLYFCFALLMLLYLWHPRTRLHFQSRGQGLDAERVPAGFLLPGGAARG